MYTSSSSSLFEIDVLISIWNFSKSKEPLLLAKGEEKRISQLMRKSPCSLYFIFSYSFSHKMCRTFVNWSFQQRLTLKTHLFPTDLYLDKFSYLICYWIDSSLIVVIHSLRVVEDKLVIEWDYNFINSWRHTMMIMSSMKNFASISKWQWKITFTAMQLGVFRTFIWWNTPTLTNTLVVLFFVKVVEYIHFED